MGALQEDSRQLEAAGCTGLALDTPKPNFNLSVADILDSVNRGLSSPEQGHLSLLTAVDGGAAFSGYEPLSPEETTYSYNRFLSEVAPQRSLCCIRLIAFMMYYTSRRPKWELVASIPQIARAIKVSERSAYNALAEAEKEGYITCLREPRKSERHSPALPGIWVLNLTYDDAQVTRAFYDGDKYRTPLPNRFLLETVMHEDLVVVRYLCCVARFTIGFAERDGRRRLSEEIGSDRLLKESGIGSKTRLIKARNYAGEKNYAIFAPGGSGGRLVYGLVWSHEWDGDRGKLGTPSIGRGKKGTPEAAAPQQNRYPEPGKKGTQVPAKEVPPMPVTRGKSGTPENRYSFEKQEFQTGIKQQHADDVVGNLVSLGIATAAAQQLVDTYPVDRILSQLECYPLRLKQREWRNPAGMLRDSIENDWAPPPQLESRRSEIEKKREREVEAERERYRVEQEPAWHAYVDDIGAKLEKEDPEGYYVFVEAEEAERDEIRNWKLSKANQTFLRKNLEHFDSAAQRRARVLRHFSGRVLDFWEWDAAYNAGLTH